MISPVKPSCCHFTSSFAIHLKRSLYCLFLSQYERILDVVALNYAVRLGLCSARSLQPALRSSRCKTSTSTKYPCEFNTPRKSQIALPKPMAPMLCEERRRSNKKKGTYSSRKRRRKETHLANGSAVETNGGPAVSFRPGNVGPQESAPNNTLFVQNLPFETTSQMSKLLFVQYPGFKEVRMIESKPGIAFVEYEDEIQAGIAMQHLQGFKITAQNAMAISYVKK
ncbi:hypothetical protein MLD38_011497 [Melastoma candidum]|uniref:Uncharacterized protein n=1 Tax=Melastoma candidum TaxID=119954 RepID=A0ACB9R2N8_9MYRT|nr:hypothetical protein MLD38_011497 [Melastoma candidum]